MTCSIKDFAVSRTLLQMNTDTMQMLQLEHIQSHPE